MVRGWKWAQLRLQRRNCVFDGAEVWSHRTQTDRRNPQWEGRGQAVGLYSRLLWRGTAVCRSVGSRLSGGRNTQRCPLLSGSRRP